MNTETNAGINDAALRLSSGLVGGYNVIARAMKLESS
jgi:hypothetical protein